MSTINDLIKQQLIGKKLRHRNQYGRTVVLEIEDVKSEHHSRDLEPATPQNDWWPRSEEWDTNKIYFVDGSSIDFSPNMKLDIVD